MRASLLVVLAVVTACGSNSSQSGTGTSTQAGTDTYTQTSSSTVTQTSSSTSTNTSSTGSSTGSNTSTATSTSTSTAGIILYGSPYANVNMWLGPVDFAETKFHNACGLSDGSSVYPAAIQALYGNYLIGLDGDHIADVESHCDNCAQLTANGNTIVAHIITYGTENGTDAIDLSPEARTALGLSDSNWTGTWQFSSCPTNGTPIYYNFDARQWNPQNFWYMRIWTRNQRLPVKSLESKLGSGSWVAATQQNDGAWQTQSGVDFSGGFQVRVTAVDGQQLVDTIPAPTSLNPANPVAGQANFQ